MKKTKIAVLAMLLVAVIALAAGCGKPEETPKEDTTAPVVSDTVVSDSVVTKVSFKTGTWATPEGTNYVFYEDGKGGRTINVADGMGVGFEYELTDDGACVFHMGSADDETKASVEFIEGSDETAAITWADGSRIVLYFVSEDTSDEFADTYVMGEITGEDDIYGNWYDAVAGRATMTVTDADGKPYFEVTWPDSAFAYYFYSFLCDVDENGKMTYTEGFKGLVEADEDGNESKKILDESADGTVELTADGKLVWTESELQDDPHEFVRTWGN